MPRSPRSFRSHPKGSRRSPIATVLVSLAVVAALYFLNEWNSPGGGFDFDSPFGTRAPTVERGASTTEKSGGFTLLHGGVLAEARNNDGDSFLVRHGDQTHEFRLYFADCPEKYRHQHNGDRIAEQGAYFGGLGEQETLRVGGEARDFTLDLLRGSPFTLLTKWEKVYDSGRYYALVRVRDAEGNEAYLHELLVARGLARIHTKGIDLPEGTPWRKQKARLAEMEKKARAEMLGGWAR